MSGVGFNRIVLVGNGFDLAMGYATSYNDFLLATFKLKMKEALTGDVHEELFTINRFRFGDDYFSRKIETLVSIEEIFDFCNQHSSLTIHSNLLRESINSLRNQRWVDIESLYFELLTEHLTKLQHGSPRNKNFSKAKGLNREMDLLTNLLESYLRSIFSGIEPTKSDDVADNWRKFQRELEGPFSQASQYLAHESSEGSVGDYPKKIYYVNFNYTPILLSLFGPNADRLNHKFIHIHGRLSDDANPVIFGYGDDSHELYEELERENNDEILRLFKAFHYPKTYNYHTLLEFMEDENYDVLVVGHSCGLSDRTLLKTVFEHVNCRGIKIYHRGNREEHFRKTIAISRHF